MAKAAKKAKLVIWAVLAERGGKTFVVPDLTRENARHTAKAYRTHTTISAVRVARVRITEL